MFCLPRHQLRGTCLQNVKMWLNEGFVRRQPSPSIVAHSCGYPLTALKLSNTRFDRVTALGRLDTT